MKKMAIVMAVGMLFLAGCSTKVPQGKLGRVKTPNGWGDSLLKPGHHTCYFRDEMYTIDGTEKTFSKQLEILVGGKINLKCTVAVRMSVNQDKEESVLSLFDKVPSTKNNISVDLLYKTYVEPVIDSVPRAIYGTQPDVQTVISNKIELEDEVAKKVIAAVSTTPAKISLCKVTNYDWPDSITKAQEELAGIELEEEKSAAKVRADLKKAEGMLKVEEANKLVEVKKAEAIAESIAVIKDSLAGAPEYLQWHTVRAMSEAATGPNNAFILFPYNMPGINMDSAVSNVQLMQLLKSREKTTK